MTQYERGIKLERDIQHFYEYNDYLVISSRGSHGDADLAVFLDNETRLIQCKLHSGLRDKIAEERFKARKVASNVTKWIAWKSNGKVGRKGIRNKKLIVIQNLIDHSVVQYIEPLSKEQERAYQIGKKAYFAAKNTKKTMVPNTIKRANISHARTDT